MKTIALFKFKNMTITPLKAEEVEDFVSLYMHFVDYLRFNCNEIYFSYSDDIREKLKIHFDSCVNNPLHGIYLARESGTVKGFIAGDMRPSFFPYASIGLNGYISAVYVMSDQRRKGITKALVEHITEDFFKKHKATYIELHCLTNNTTAKDLWRTLGYKVFREQWRIKLQDG